MDPLDGVLNRPPNMGLHPEGSESCLKLGLQMRNPEQPTERIQAPATWPLSS